MHHPHIEWQVLLDEHHSVQKQVHCAIPTFQMLLKAAHIRVLGKKKEHRRTQAYIM